MYPFGENLYQKLPILAISGHVSPHFERHNGEIWREAAGLGLPPPRLILYIKKSLKGIRPLGANFYRKFEFFAISNFRNI